MSKLIPCGLDNLQSHVVQLKIPHPRTRTAPPRVRVPGPNIPFAFTAGAESVPRNSGLPKTQIRKNAMLPPRERKGHLPLALGLVKIPGVCLPNAARARESRGGHGGLNAGRAGRGPVVGWDFGT